MRAVIQRTSGASVAVGDRVVGSVGRGLVVLLGVARGDDAAGAERLAGKICQYRIFPDEEGKMNLSVRHIEGELLVISQFTLCADTRKGRRPGFDAAAPPEEALALYEHFVACARRLGLGVQTGEFGAMMRVSLVNDGPVTFVFET